MNFTRRHFLKASASAAAFASIAPFALGENEKPASKQRSLKKAIMWGTVGFPGSTLEKCKAIKAAGFHGFEANSHMDQAEVLKAREETGLEIPSVCCSTHWAKPLSHPSAAIREEGLAGLKQSLQDAKKYGATSVLLVPGIVNESISYADAWTRTQEEIKKAIPLAEELGVKIAIENVWNNFLLSPLEAARYVDEFKSQAVGWHFDIGNVLRYGWPEQWITTLGQRIQKLHIKEYSRKKMNESGLFSGFQVQYLEGDNDWAAIMKSLDNIGYNGWAIAEPAYSNPASDAEGLKNVSDRMDKMFAL